MKHETTSKIQEKKSRSTTDQQKGRGTIGQSVGRSVGPSVGRSVGRSVRRSVGRLVHRSVNRSVCHEVASEKAPAWRVVTSERGTRLRLRRASIYFSMKHFRQTKNERCLPHGAPTYYILDTDMYVPGMYIMCGCTTVYIYRIPHDVVCEHILRTGGGN